MRIDDVNERYGGGAQLWVWSTRPEHVFEPDGRERPVLEPIDTVTLDAYEDEVGWWTCHKDTRMHDLAVLYRNGSASPAGDQPPRGPKDFRYVMLATSDAFPLVDDPTAGRFSGHHGCLYVPVAKLDPAVTLEEVRSWGLDFPALRAGFIQAAMPLPRPVWDEMVRAARRQRPKSRPPLDPGPRKHLERDLEEWLIADDSRLSELVGAEVEFKERQVACEDHGGVLDVLAEYKQRRGHYVVLELKAAEIKRDAIAQAMGYVGWLRSYDDIKSARGIVVGVDLHPQVPWVLEALESDTVEVRRWAEVDLPVELHDRLTAAS